MATPLHNQPTSNQMLSRPLTQLLEHLRTRFGVEVEVRPPVTLVSGVSADAARPEVVSYLIREMLEMDAAGAEAIERERDRSRRLLATLRFLRHMVDMAGDAELADTLLNAIAVWFDVDARVYERDLTGGYVLLASLPGADVPETEHRLNPQWTSGILEPRRVKGLIGSAHRGAHDVLLIPVAATGSPEWVLALIGAPSDVAPELAILSRVIGAQLELLRARRREALGQRFGEILRADLAPETIARQAVGTLLAVSRAGGASLTLTRGRRVRRLAVLGSLPRREASLRGDTGDWIFTPDRIVCTLSAGNQATLALEMRPLAGQSFSADAAMATRVGVEMLQTCLRGGALIFDEPDAVAAKNIGAVAFLRRLDEEVERATRLDLRLSLVVLDLPRQARHADNAERLHETLRGELRESDILGRMDPHRVAALLPHTDANESEQVARRLRRKLQDSLPRLHLSGVSVGHAGFSPECRTAEAMLSQAVRDAEPVAAV